MAWFDCFRRIVLIGTMLFTVVTSVEKQILKIQGLESFSSLNLTEHVLKNTTINSTTNSPCQHLNVSNYSSKISLVPSFAPTFSNRSFLPSTSPSPQPTTALIPTLSPSQPSSPTSIPSILIPTFVPTTISLNPSLSPSIMPTSSPTHQRIVETPKTNPPGGSGVMVIYVSLQCDTLEANIFYTIDGSQPTESGGNQYVDGVPIPLYADDCQPNCMVKAIATKQHWKSSLVISETFHVQHKADPPILSPAGGMFVGSVIVDVSVNNNDYSSTSSVRYATNSSPSSSSSNSNLGEGLVDMNGESIDGYHGSVVMNGDQIVLEFSDNELVGGSQIITLNCMSVRYEYAPSTIVTTEYLLLARSPKPIFSPDYQTPQPYGAYLSITLNNFPKTTTTIIWTSDGIDPYVQSTHSNIDSGSFHLSPTQRSCIVSSTTKQCEIHVDEIGITMFKAISSAPGFEPSEISIKMIEIQERCLKPQFNILSKQSNIIGNSGQDENLITFTSFVEFQFSCQTEGNVIIEYEVVGATGIGAGTTVGIGIEIIWKQLGTVTFIARATKKGMFSSADVKQTFIIIEPIYEVYPIQSSLIIQSTSQSSRDEKNNKNNDEDQVKNSHHKKMIHWEDFILNDPTLPNLSLNHFTQSFKDISSSSTSNCQIHLKGVSAIISQPERYLSVLPPLFGSSLSTVSSQFRFKGIEYDDDDISSFQPESFDQRSHWVVTTDESFTQFNATNLVQRAWNDETAWSSYHAQPTTFLKDENMNEDAWSPFSGCSLLISGGLVNSTTHKNQKGDDSGDDRSLGHLISDGITIQIDDGNEHSTTFGVKRDKFLGVDFGIRNNSFVIGYIPSQEINQVPTHSLFTQLITAEVWLVRRSKVYVLESLNYGGYEKIEQASKFANQRLGRTAWGHDELGRLIVVTVEGQTETITTSSEDDDNEDGEKIDCDDLGGQGITLIELAELMIDLGCVNAVSGVGGKAEMTLNGVHVGGASSSCGNKDDDIERNVEWKCNPDISSMLCIHMAPPPIIEFSDTVLESSSRESLSSSYSSSSSSSSSNDWDLVWPWSPPKQPSYLPTTFSPSSLPTPTLTPTKVPNPSPTIKQFVIGVDDDYWQPPGGGGNFDDIDDVYKNETSTYINQEMAFYKTSTLMLFFTLCFSGFLHLYTWNNQAKEEEKRLRSSQFGDDENSLQLKYNEDGTIATGIRRSSGPVVSYGGNSYGTKVATSPISALRELARRSRRKPKGYDLVNGGLDGLEEGEYEEEEEEEEEDEDGYGLEMVDTAMNGRRGGLLNGSDNYDFQTTSSVSKNRTSTNKFLPQNDDSDDDSDNDDDDEDFESKFKRIDRVNEQLKPTLGSLVKNILPVWLGGREEVHTEWTSMGIKKNKNSRKNVFSPFGSTDKEQGEESEGVLEVNPFAFDQSPGKSKNRMFTPRMIAMRREVVN